jgi:hypothetical protein
LLASEAEIAKWTVGTSALVERAKTIIAVVVVGIMLTHWILHTGWEHASHTTAAVRSTWTTKHTTAKASQSWRLHI